MVYYLIYLKKVGNRKYSGKTLSRAEEDFQKNMSEESAPKDH